MFAINLWLDILNIKSNSGTKMQICIHHFMVTINTRKLNTNGWKFDNSSSDSKNSIDCMICKHYKRCVQKHAQKKESRCYIDQTVPFLMKFVGTRYCEQDSKIEFDVLDKHGKYFLTHKSMLRASLNGFHIKSNIMRLHYSSITFCILCKY